MKIIIPFIILILAIVGNARMNFQKNIWVYWETQFEKAPLIVKSSFQKLSIAAKKANWTITLLNGTNIKDYLTDYEVFQKVVDNGVRATVQQKSDILRVAVVAQNGGMWIDFSCILYEDLSWLQNQKPYEELIINRYGLNKDDPDMFMVGQGSHQSRLSDLNSQGVLQAEYFGYAIYFIAAKKNSKIMIEWRNNIYNLSQTKIQKYMKRLNDQRVYLHMIDRSDGYYTGNVALDQVIQKRQFQLDKQVSVLSRRVTASQYYKIWAVHGEVGPCGLTRYHQFVLRDLFFKTRAQVQERLGKLHFFLKLAKYVRDYIMQNHDKTYKYLTDNKLTIQDLLKTATNRQECTLSFIVQGSLLDELFNNSIYKNQLKIPIITVSQRDQYEARCSGHIAPYERYLGWSHGQLTKPQRQLYVNEVQTFNDRLKLFWKVNDFIFANTSDFMNEIFKKFMICLFIFSVSIKMVFFVLKKGFNLNQNEIVDYVIKQVLINTQTILSFILVAARLGCVVLCLQFEYLVQQMGGFPQFFQTLLVALIVVTIDVLLQKQLQHCGKQRVMFVSVQQMYDLTIIPIYLPLIFVSILHFQKLYILAFKHAVAIAGVGIVLFQIIAQMSKRKGLNDEWISYFSRISGNFRYVLVGMLAILNFTPNFKFYVIANTYLKEYFVDIFYNGTYFLIILVLAFIISAIWKVYSANQFSKAQDLKKFALLKISITFALLMWCLYESEGLYNKLYFDPNSIRHDYCLYSIIVQFTLLSIQLKTIFSQRQNVAIQTFEIAMSFTFIIVNMFVRRGYLMITHDYIIQQLMDDHWKYRFYIAAMMAVSDFFMQEEEQKHQIKRSDQKFYPLQQITNENID